MKQSELATQETKSVFSIDQSTLGQEKVVNNNYNINTIYETEEVPPKDALILAWDNKTRNWYDAGSNTEVRLNNVELALTELYEMILGGE